MIISIGGTVGSGKSTLAKQLARKLRWPRYYMGQVFRDLARQQGLTLRAYVKNGETNPRIDRQVDEYQINLGRTQDNFIIEGRTSFFLIPQSLKIYLFCDPDTAARRVFKDLKKNARLRNEGVLSTLADVKKDLIKRMATDRKRYRQYYQKNVFNRKHYDFTLDTSRLNRQQVFGQVYRFYREQISE